MNKKVFTSALSLIIIFLVAQYILKFFFPDTFMLYVENEHIVSAGNFIDTHTWLYLPVTLLIGLVSDYLFFGAVCRKFKLHWSLWIIILVYNMALACLYAFAPMFLAAHSNLIVCCSMCYMFLVPLFYTKDFRPLVIVYLITNIAQLLTLVIRDLTPLLTSANTLTVFLLSLESFLWAALCLIIFNFNKKEETKMGMVKPWYGKSKYWEKKRDKSLKVIDKHQKIVKACDEVLTEIATKEVKA